MRRYVLLGHKVPLTPDFSLNDIPGTAGRLDVLCRGIGAAFFLSHGIRQDVETTLLLQGEVQITIEGDRVKRMNPDERSTAALIRHALAALPDDDGVAQSTPGIRIARRSLDETLDRLYQAEATPVLLHEAGVPIDGFSFPENPAFILSDHLDFTDDEMRAFEKMPHVSLGSTALHASQCITILNYLLDRQAEDVNSDLVLCHTVWGEPQALLIKGLLEDFDIPVNLLSHVPPSVYPMALDGLSEIRIMVRPRDLDRAQQVVRDYFEEPIDD